METILCMNTDLEKDLSCQRVNLWVILDKGVRAAGINFCYNFPYTALFILTEMHYLYL